MSRIALGFHLHLPHRLRSFRYFDIGRQLNYCDDAVTSALLSQMLAVSWRPALDALAVGVAGVDRDFRFYLALSGTLLDQLAVWAPQELDRLRRLSDSGKVEFVITTASQSLAALHAPEEFLVQARSQRDRLSTVFGQPSSTFRNTAPLSDAGTARSLDKEGFRAVLAPAHARLLGWRKAQRPFAAAPCPNLRVLPCDLRLAALFGGQTGVAGALPTLDHFIAALSGADSHSDGFCLDLPLLAFSGHGVDGQGGFDFLRAICAAVPERTPFRWALPGELSSGAVVASVSAPATISAESPTCDASPWIGSGLQRDAFDTLYALEDRVRAAGDQALASIWRTLQDATYLREMDPSTAQPGATPAGASPYDAYMSFMNILSDLESRL
ncbi:MAG: hypothetical protein WCL16_03965 [bacterium]